MSLPQTNADRGQPYLEYYPEPGGPPHRIVLEPLPFRIGRNLTANYVIYSRQVSKEHAEIFRSGAQVRIRDLGSTNGTFVNGQRVSEAGLESGDIIHVAHKELRFGCGPAAGAEAAALPVRTEPAGGAVPASLIRGSQDLRDMLLHQRVRVVFQPVVHLGTGMVLGYEALGRGTHSALSANPAELFHLADRCNLGVELSRVFRAEAAREAAHLPAATRVFFNLHPSEILDPGFVESLRELRSAFRPDQQMVLEVHEEVVADVEALRRLRRQLAELGVGLAYDDFGVGQARLKELAEVPPDFVKLDRSLIQGIEHAAARQELVQALNRVGAELHVETIAEGVETPEEALTCGRLGCRFAQGYLFGRPQPLALLRVGEVASSVFDAGPDKTPEPVPVAAAP